MSVEYSLATNAAAVEEGRCRVLERDVADMGFAGGSFDLVTAFETLYFWPDTDAAFAEIARVLRPGARFMVCNEADGDVDKAEQLVELIEGMTVYDAGQISAMMERAGLVDVEVHAKPARAWLAVIGTKS